MDKIEYTLQTLRHNYNISFYNNKGVARLVHNAVGRKKKPLNAMDTVVRDYVNNTVVLL